MEALSDKLLLEVLVRLDTMSLVRAGQVCCRWRLLSRDPTVWAERDLVVLSRTSPFAAVCRDLVDESLLDDGAALVLDTAPYLLSVLVCGKPTENQLRALQHTRTKILTFGTTPAYTWKVTWLEAVLENVGHSLESLQLPFMVAPSLMSVIDSLPNLQMLSCLSLVDSPSFEEEPSSEEELQTAAVMDGGSHSVPMQVKDRGDGSTGGLKYLSVRECYALCSLSIVSSLVWAHRSTLEFFECGCRCILGVGGSDEQLLSSSLDDMMTKLSACPKLRSVHVGLCDKISLLQRAPLLGEAVLIVASKDQFHLLYELPLTLERLGLDLRFRLSKTDVLNVSDPIVRRCRAMPFLKAIRVTAIRDDNSYDEALKAVLKANFPRLCIRVEGKGREERSNRYQGLPLDDENALLALAMEVVDPALVPAVLQRVGSTSDDASPHGEAGSGGKAGSQGDDDVDCF